MLTTAQIARQDATQRKHCILIVDDNDGMRELMSEMLQDEGFDIIEANNGISALELVDSKEPDLILLDVRMPGISGFEVCRRIRETRDESSVAIAMVTGLEDHESIETAYKLGATTFLNKPINWTSFSYRVRYILRARDALAQLKQRETQLSHLDRITRILTQDKHYDTIMHEALLSILDIFDAERAFIIKTDDGSLSKFDIEYGATQGLDASVLGEIGPLFDTIGECIEASREHPDDTVIYHPDRADHHAPVMVNQQMLLPLHVQQDISWYLCVQQCHPGAAWKQNDSDIFYNLGTRLSGMLSRHLLVEQLHTSERLLKQAQRIGHIGNWHWQANGDSISWSAEAYRIFGYHPDSFSPLFDEYYKVAYDEDLSRLSQLREEARTNGKAYDIEYRIRHDDDSVRWINEQAIASLDEHGAVKAISGIVQDITDRQKKQEQEAHEKKMESIGQLTSGIAHDFGNLMTIAKGNLDILSEQLTEHDELDSDEQSVLADARSAIADSVELTRQLLDFSRRKSISPKYVHVRDNLERLQLLLRHTFNDNIDVRLEVKSQLPDILVDPTQLESALLNVCINASNAMPEGGTILVEACEIDCDASQYEGNPGIDIGDNAVAITVSDDGVGMSKEVADRATEPFFTTNATDGTGLGLSMVYGFMRQSKGELSIVSEQNEGTTIRLIFPVYHGTATAAAEQQPPRSSEQALRSSILVVEDQDSVRQFAVRCLSPQHKRVLAARDAEEALSILDHDQGIDLLFSDIMMPGSMNGRDLAEWVSEHRPELGVLLTTASALEIQRNETDEEHRFSLLAKPYSKQALLHAVEDCLQQSRT